MASMSRVVVVGKSVVDFLAALTVYKGVQLGIQSSKFHPIKEPIKLSAWDAVNISRHDQEVKQALRNDAIVAASGVSILYFISPYLRNLIANSGKQVGQNVWQMCKNSYSFSHGFLPRTSIFRRLFVVNGLVIALPLLLPPKSLNTEMNANSIINTEIYNPVKTLRDFVTYPLLQTLLFHKILFLRVLPVIGPVGAHVLTAVAYTVASSTQNDNSLNFVKIMANLNESLIMQLSFYLSGGRVLYPFVFRSLQNLKDLIFHSLTSFSIIEHAHLYRAMVENAVNENLKVYCSSNIKSNSLEVFVETPPNTMQERESSDALATSLFESCQTIQDISKRVLQKFSSSSSVSPTHLSVLDAADFVFSFRAAIGMCPTYRGRRPLVELSSGKDETFGAVVVKKKPNAQNSNNAIVQPRDAIFSPMPPHLIPVFCTDMAYILVKQKYPQGMDLKDIMDFISHEVEKGGSLKLKEEEMLEAEKRMYRPWMSFRDFNADDGNGDDKASIENNHDTGSTDFAEKTDVSSPPLMEILKEVYRTIVLAQVQTCAVLATHHFNTANPLSKFDDAYLEAIHSPQPNGYGEENNKSKQELLVGQLHPEEVETYFGPSHTHGIGHAAAIPVYNDDESVMEGSQLAREVKQEEGLRSLGEDVTYNPLNCILSTVSRRAVISTLYPHGLTLRRFQLLIDRAESDDENIKELHERLRSELQSIKYKNKLRREILQNIEKEI